jgi:co-chaperonin GroES (HSP10)
VTKQESWQRAYDRLGEGGQLLVRILAPCGDRMLVALEPDDLESRQIVAPQTALAPLQQRGTVMRLGEDASDSDPYEAGSRVVVAAFAGMEYEHQSIQGGKLKLIVDTDVVAHLDDYDRLEAPHASR